MIPNSFFIILAEVTLFISWITFLSLCPSRSASTLTIPWPPKIANYYAISENLESSLIVILYWYNMAPASNCFFEISITETPVSFSDFNIACYIGQDPRYLGSKDGCITNIPFLNLSMMESGIMWPKEATTPTSYYSF